MVAIVALRNPKPDSTNAGTQTATTSQSAEQSGSGSPEQSGTGSRSSSRPSTSRPTSSRTKSQSKSPSNSTSRSTSTSPSRTGAVGSLPLVVLNQSGTLGLADSAAQRFRSSGWQVTSTDDNYINDVVTTTAYFDPAVSGSQAAANALQRQFPTIKRVAERFSNLTPGPVVVVLTADYSTS